MKQSITRFLTATVVAFLAMGSVWADKATETKYYKILSISCNNKRVDKIRIGGEDREIGQSFKQNEEINWADDRQQIRVQEQNSGRQLTLMGRDFNNKKAKSLTEYLKQQSYGSSRGDNNITIEIRESENSERFSEKRIAMVVGNNNYDHLPWLRNPQSDAFAVSEALSEIGFDVIELYETNDVLLKTAFNRFISMAKDYNIALFYYAGHGVQHDNHNYLIPTNVEASTEKLRLMLNATDVMKSMDTCGAKVRLIYLDACRNDLTGTRGAVLTDFASMEGEKGTFIMLSTGKGQTATDGDGMNSPFAAAFVKHIKAKDTDFTEAMTNIQRATYKATGEKQAPTINSRLIGKLILNPVENRMFELRGSVTNESGKPLVGAIVMINGTVANTSDINGNFHAKAKKGDVITAEYTGYHKRQMTVGNRSKLVMKLKAKR